MENESITPSNAGHQRTARLYGLRLGLCRVDGGLCQFDLRRDDSSESAAYDGRTYGIDKPAVSGLCAIQRSTGLESW